MTTPSPSPGTGDSDLAATLQQIRERHVRGLFSSFVADIAASSNDIPRLLAAIGAVLELADKWDSEARGIFLEAARTADAGEVGAASALQSAAADIRMRVRSSLAGDSSNEKEGDG